jgi:hypothetical protein
MTEPIAPPGFHCFAPGVVDQPGVAEVVAWDDRTQHPPRCGFNVRCENGAAVYVWLDTAYALPAGARSVLDATAAEVAVEGPDGEDVRWSDATLLADQPCDSVVSLVRMVCRSDG